MPAGISEGLIRRAFAPIDLSYAYQRLDATQRILNAEDRALKQQAQKDYYTELASIKKDLGGVRSEDIAEISKKYKQWADVSRQLAANPRLITRNPDKYGELKSQADTLYGQTLKDIEESKEMKKLLQSTTEKLGDVRNFDLLDEGAYEKFKQNALFRPTKELVQTGAYSFNNYLSPIVDGRAFLDAAQREINEKGIIKDAQVEDTQFKDQYGRKKYDKVKNVPVDISIYNIAVKNLGNLKNRANTFAQQRLDELASSGEDVRILQEYEDFYKNNKNKGFEKYINSDNMLVYNPSAPPKDRYAKLYAMSEFLDRTRIMTKEVGQPTKLDEIRKMEISSRLRKTETGGGEKQAPMIDIHSSMLRKFPVQGQKEKALMFPGTKFIPEKQLKEFNADEQSAVVSFLKEIGFESPNAADFRLQRADNNDIIVVSNVDFVTGKDVRYAKGKPVTTIPGKSLNIKASGVLGVGGRKSAAIGRSEAEEAGL
jgi:hypothetical protein